jgi:6-phosphogluconolactonase
MTNSQHWLVAGSYAAADQAGIHVFTFDAVSGDLTARGSFAGVLHPSFLVAHPTGRRLYTVSETAIQREGAPGAVWAWDMTQAPDRLPPLNHQASGGDWPCHLTLDAAGRWLLVANYASGTVGVLPVGADGTLGALADCVQHQGRGPHPTRQEGPHAHATAFTPDGRFVVVTDLGSDALLVYAFDSAAGRLHPHARVPTHAGAGPRHLAFHPDGARLYVSNELDNSVTVYDYDAARGRLHAQQTLATLPRADTTSTVAHIAVAPGGERVYVSNRGDDSVAIFDVGADGQLTRVAVQPCGGRWPRHFALAPGGRFLLVANQYSDEVVVLPVRADAAGLGPPVGRALVPGAACVQFLAAGP